MNNKYFLEKLTTILFYLSIILFFTAFNFQDSLTSGWYQQFMPNPLGGQIKDIYFVDSLLGFAISDSCILKTTNGGDNWSIKLYSTFFTRIKFLNSSTGIASDAFHLNKTTNAGENWTALQLSGDLIAQDMSVISQDTIFICNDNALVGGVFLTTNGGVNWQVKYSQTSYNPSHIYMYNGRLGFMDGGGLKRTTDGGNSWTTVTGGSFSDMYFIDSLTGWKSNQLMKKTTDGGITWVNQPVPSGGNIIINYLDRFSNVNKDTIWGIGGTYWYGGYQDRGMIYRTTNGGNNWYYQIPDTSIHIDVYSYNQFVNKRVGWAYVYSNGVHTITGGDSTFIMQVPNIPSNIPPKNFELKQNYPNPFNPVTNIKYKIEKTSLVKIIVFSIDGKEISTLINKKLSSGNYEVTFNGNNLSSGIYFYSLIINGERIDTKKMILVK